MINKIKLSISFALILMLGIATLLIQSCKKNVNQVPGTTIKYDNSKKVNATITGILVDESGTPIEMATVSTGNYTTQTDLNGLFYFNNISTPEHNTTIKASKSGYFTGFRSIAIKAGQKHTISLALMAKGTAETFTASNGGTVSFAGGLSLSFPANGIVNKNTGAAYTGQVYVYAKKIDPTTALGRSTMPGDLRGIAASNGEEKLLQSFGMLVAELYDVNNNPLQLSSNAEATISLDIPPSLVGSATSSIPLWYFDETKEIWVEEGVATLQGGKYVGKVKHFSFWNCDTPAAAINLDVTLQDQNGNPLQGYVVKLTNTANSDTRYGTTNASGWVGGLVYSNATMTLEVLGNTNICASTTPLLTQTITTGSSNLSLGVIVVTILPANTTSIEGIVWDCANAPVPNAVVVLEPFNIVINADALGQFSYSMPCTPSQPIKLVAYDMTSLQFDSTASISLVGGVNNVGNIVACGNATPFLNISLTNTFTNTTANFTFLPPTSTITGDASVQSFPSFIAAYDSSGGGTTNGRMLQFYAADSVIGTWNVTSAYLNGIGTFTDNSWTLSTGATNTVTYTSFPSSPGDILGSYSLTFIGSPSGNTYTATGSFRAPRQ